MFLTILRKCTYLLFFGSFCLNCCCFQDHCYESIELFVEIADYHCYSLFDADKSYVRDIGIPNHDALCVIFVDRRYTERCGYCTFAIIANFALSTKTYF